MSLVLKQVQNGTGLITLNHQAKRNALSRSLLDELIASLDELSASVPARSSCERSRAQPSGRPGTTSPSCRPPAATRWLTTTRSAAPSGPSSRSRCPSLP